MILLAINGTENETNGFKQTRRSCRAAQGAKAPSPLRGCDPPKAFILHREIVLTMKRVSLCARISRLKSRVLRDEE